MAQQLAITTCRECGQEDLTTLQLHAEHKDEFHPEFATAITGIKKTYAPAKAMIKTAPVTNSTVQRVMTKSKAKAKKKAQ